MTTSTFTAGDIITFDPTGMGRPLIAEYVGIQKVTATYTEGGHVVRIPGIKALKRVRKVQAWTGTPEQAARVRAALAR